MRQGFLFSIIVSIIFCAPALAYDWSTNPGDGSEANPYQISTPEQLMSIGSNADLLDKHFELVNDIVFDPNNNPQHVFDKALIASDTDNRTSGFQGTPFSGCFDGNEYSILNLKIVNDSYTNSDFLGIFGHLQGSTDTISVRNLFIVNPVFNIGYEARYVGALCGMLTDGIVENCHVDALVISSDWTEARGGGIGGLIAQNESGLVRDCSVNCKICGICYLGSAGGLTGRNTGTLENSTVNCTILVGDCQYGYGAGVGGVTGYNDGNITGCVSKGYIEGTGGVGGVIGRNSGDCSRSFFIGAVSCHGFATWDIGCGGFVGANGGYIQECYSISQIRLRYTVRAAGGFVGYHDGGAIDRCGSWSKIVCESLCEPRGTGGFLGRSPGGGISNCYSQGEIQTDNENMYTLGGFAGDCPYDITKCYTTVGQIHGQIHPDRDYSIYAFGNFYGFFENLKSFYDLQRSNVFNNVFNDYDQGSGTSLRTKKMQEKTSFLAAGWDFVGEDENGTEDIWIMDSEDYPRLAWLPKVSVPEVLNRSLQDVQTKIESAGLTVGDIRYHYSESVKVVPMRWTESPLN